MQLPRQTGTDSIHRCLQTCHLLHPHQHIASKVNLLPRIKTHIGICCHVRQLSCWQCFYVSEHTLHKQDYASNTFCDVKLLSKYYFTDTISAHVAMHTCCGKYMGMAQPVTLHCQQHTSRKWLSQEHARDWRTQNGVRKMGHKANEQHMWTCLFVPSPRYYGRNTSEPALQPPPA